MPKMKFEVTFLLANDDQTDRATLLEIFSDIVRKGFRNYNSENEVHPDYAPEIVITDPSPDSSYSDFGTDNEIVIYPNELAAGPYGGSPDAPRR